MINLTNYSELESLVSANNWSWFYVNRYDLSETVIGYIAMSGCGDCVFYANVIGADKTDFDTDHKSGATSVNSFDEGVSKIAQLGEINKVFDSEALADGVYEDGDVVAALGPNKTINVKNEHGTNGLAFKVWGSPDNSEWEEIISETTVAANSNVSVTNNDFWKYVKVSAKGNGGASTVTAYIQVK